MIEHQTQEHIDLDIESPWPGLHEFNEQDTDYFNGRVEETAALVRLIRNETLTVLFGRSGLGKTSLLRAGLFPKLRQKQWLPAYIRLDFSMDSGPLIEQVRSRFIQELENRRVDHQDFSDGETLWEYLHRPDRELWSSTNELLTPIFIFDQFEEIFTLGAANVQSVKQFRADLSDLIENRIPGFLVEVLEESGSSLDLRSHQYKVLLSFREDYLPDMESWRIEIPSIMRNRLRLMPMNGTQAFYAVFNTGKNLVNEEISRDIVRFVAAAQVDVGASSVRQASTGIHAPTEQTGSQPIEDLIVEPALLSLVCYELNERRKIAGKQHIDQGLLQGTGSAILTEFYEKSTKDLPQQTRRFIQENLVTESGFRNSYPRDDALNQHLINEEELEHLIHKRLLRVESQMGTDRIELIHDLLTGVVCEFRNRDREKKQREIERQKRRKWLRLGIASITTIILISLGFAYQALERAGVKAEMKKWIATKRIADVQKNLFGIESGRSGGDELALLQLLAAYSLHKTNHETQSALLRGTLEFRNVYKLITVGSPVYSLSYSSDGKRIVSCNQDGSMQQWDSQTGLKIGEPLKGHDGAVNGAVYSPERKRIVSAGSDGTLRIWNAENGEPVGDPLIEHSEEVSSVAYNKDGTRIVSASKDGILWLWNAENGDLIGDTLRGHGREASPVAYNKDGIQPMLDADLVGLLIGRGYNKEGYNKEINHVTFSPNGKLIVSAGSDRTLRIWDAESGEQIGKPFRKHIGRINHVAFNPHDREQFVSASSDGEILIWNAKDSLPILRPNKYKKRRWLRSGVNSVEYSRDGKYIVSAHSDGTLQLWNAVNGVPLGQPLKGHDKQVTSVRFSPNGKRFASASLDGTVRIWNAETEKAFGQRLARDKKGVNHIVFSRDGKRYVSAHQDSSLRIWDTENDTLIGIPIEGRKGPVHISSFDFSPDGKQFVTGSQDGTLLIWNAENSQPVGEPLTGHKQKILYATHSSDGKHIVSVSSDGMLRQWDAKTGEAITEPLRAPVPAIINTIAFSHDRKHIAVGYMDGTLRLWNVENGKPIGEPFTEHSKEISLIEYGPDGKRFVSTSQDSTLQLWNVENGVPPIGKPLKGQRELVKRIVFTTNGKRIISASQDNTLLIWNAENGEPIGKPIKGQTGLRGNVTFSPVHAQFVTASQDGTLQIWDAENGEPIGKPIKGQTGLRGNITFSPVHAQFVTASRDGTLQIWDAENGKPIGEPYKSRSGLLHNIVFSPDGKRFVTASRDGTLQIWDAENGKPIGESYKSRSGLLHNIVFSHDGERFVTASRNGMLQIWNAENGELIVEPCGGCSRWVSSILFSPFDKRFITSNLNGTLQIWNVENGKQIGKTIKGQTGKKGCVAFSPDGKRFVTASRDSTLQIWNAENGEAIGKPLKGHVKRVSRIEYTRDGKQIISQDLDNTLRIWDADNSEPIGEPIRGNKGEEIICLAYNSKEKKIVFGQSDGQLLQWDMGMEEKVLIGEHQGLQRVAYSPDGKRSVTASRDSTLQIWDAVDGKPIGDPFRGHKGQISCVAFSSDGKYIFSASQGGSLWKWPVSPSAWRYSLCQKLTRNMSKTEWEEWVSSEIKYNLLCPDLPVPENNRSSTAQIQK